MRTCSIQQSGFHVRKDPPKDKSTAYYLFDKSDASNLFPIKLNATHFRAYNKTLNLPIATDGSAEDFERLATEMIPTAATAYQIMQHYMEGADIEFHVKNVPAKIYRRIVNHLQAHLEAMRTSITYVPPPPESFEQWGEFALAIRPMALRADKFLESGPRTQVMHSFMMRRPTFSAPEEQKVVERTVVPQSTRTLSAITSFLEKTNEW